MSKFAELRKINVNDKSQGWPNLFVVGLGVGHL